MFDPDRFYPAGDPALESLAKAGTMAHWRCEGRGPAYIKLSGRVLYHGKALNDWIEANTIQPTQKAGRPRERSRAAS